MWAGSVGRLKQAITISVRSNAIAVKPATMETGLEVAVPLFVHEGETLKIDTRTGAYMGRA